MSDQKSSNEQEKTKTEKSVTGSESLRVLEAVLFASDDVVSATKLKSILPDKPDARAIRKMVDEINVQMQQERHPFEIIELAGGYQFRTISYYQPWVQQVFKEKSAKKISIQGLECLAIIAYKQPISKAQIEAIRGVLSEGAMKTLLEKHFITIVGRSDKPGRPLLYGTTQEFLKYFGINKLSDLPKIEEFETIAKEKMKEFYEEESAQDGIETNSRMASDDSEESENTQNNKPDITEAVEEKTT